MRSRLTDGAWLRDAVRGRGVAVTVSVLCLVTSVLFLLAVLQSDDLIFWTGKALPGREENGLVYYRYHGANLTLDVPHSFANRDHVTVYLDPHNPDHVELDSPGTRVIDAAGVLGPLLIAAVVWTVTVVSDRRRRRTTATGFGSGIPEELLDRIRNDRRSGR